MMEAVWVAGGRVKRVVVRRSEGRNIFDTGWESMERPSRTL